MIHKLDLNQSWTPNLYQNLEQCIKSHFKLQNKFVIRNIKGIEIKNIDDIKNQNEINPNNMLFTLSMKQIKSNHKLISMSQEKLLSLGQRLKLLHEEIVINDYNNDYKLQIIRILEMAQVEGFDQDSHITMALKDIEMKLSNDKLNGITLYLITTKIKEIISYIMPFNYQQFFKLFKATHDTNLSDKACWVLLGPTGSFSVKNSEKH